MTKKKFTKQNIAELAGALTGAYMEALKEQEQHGLHYPDLVFSAIVALKGVGMMLHDNEDEVVEDLREIIEHALAANVVGKRFKTEAEMNAWLAEQGKNPDGSPLTPTGPVH
jgi:predicted site-specific integrase-resolvase